jgi:hypothetical protein
MRYVPLLSICLAAACGSNSDDNGTACASLAAAKCARIAACSPVLISRRYGDPATCQAREKSACVAALAAPQTANSAANAMTCAAAYPTQSCSDVFNSLAPAVCVYVGPRDTGKPCSVNAQCKSSFCSTPYGSACGTCQDASVAGASCSASPCSRGFDCVPSTLQCQTPGAASANCDAAHTCQAGLACVGATATAMGACQAQVTSVGATCDPNRRMSANCAGDLGLYCDATSKQCKMVAFAAEGAACGDVSGVGTQCTVGACYGASGTTPGTCKMRAADGAACDSVNGPDCQVGSRCIGTATGGGATGTCQPLNTAACG